MAGYDEGFRHLLRSTVDLESKISFIRKKQIAIGLLIIFVIVTFRFIGLRNTKQTQIKSVSSLQDNYEAKITPFAEPGVDTKNGFWKGFSFQYPASMNLYFGSLDKDYFNLSGNVEREKYLDFSAVKILGQVSITDTLKNRLQSFYNIENAVISTPMSNSAPHEITSEFTVNETANIVKIKAYSIDKYYYIFAVSALKSYYDSNQRTVDNLYDSIRRTSF